MMRVECEMMMIGGVVVEVSSQLVVVAVVVVVEEEEEEEEERRLLLLIGSWGCVSVIIEQRIHFPCSKQLLSALTVSFLAYT